MRAMIQVFISCVLLLAGLSSCQEGEVKKDEPQTAVFTNFKNARGFLSLTSTVTGWDAKISGCRSGYEVNVSHTSTNIFVHDGDYDCQFRMTSLTLGDDVYLPAQDSSWVEGSSVTFTSQTNQNQLEVNVIAQLQSPINGGQNVLMLLDTAESGGSQAIGAGVSSGMTIAFNDQTINLQIHKSIVRVDDKGHGVFRFFVNCAEPLTDLGNSEWACSGMKMSKLIYGMTQDSFGGDLDISECRTAAGGAYAFNGAPKQFDGLTGFGTYFMSVGGLLYDPNFANLIFAIRDGIDGSCKYFKVEIQ